MQGLLVLEDHHVPWLQRYGVHDIGMIGGGGEQLEGKLRIGTGRFDTRFVVAAIQAIGCASVCPILLG